MSERLAVIKDFSIGVGDRGRPAIWFSTYINESTAALQVIEGAEAIHDFIAQVGLEDLTKVNGKTCWVQEDGMMIKYLKMAGI